MPKQQVTTAFRMLSVDSLYCRYSARPLPSPLLQALAQRAHDNIMAVSVSLLALLLLILVTPFPDHSLATFILSHHSVVVFGIAELLDLKYA